MSIIIYAIDFQMTSRFMNQMNYDIKCFPLMDEQTSRLLTKSLSAKKLFDSLSKSMRTELKT